MLNTDILAGLDIVRGGTKVVISLPHWYFESQSKFKKHLLNTYYVEVIIPGFRQCEQAA